MMKKLFYNKRNLRMRLWILCVIVFIALVEIKWPVLKILGATTLTILGYHFFLTKDYRIGLDDEYIYLDNIFDSRQIPLVKVMNIERNKWYFTEISGLPAEFGYKIYYNDQGFVKEKNALVGTGYFDEFEKFRKQFMVSSKAST